MVHGINTLDVARKDAMTVTTKCAKNVVERGKVLFNESSTTQKYEQFDTLTGFGLPSSQGSGAPLPYDVRRKLYSGQVTPIVYALGYEVTELAEYTDQFGEISQNQPLVVKSMAAGRETKRANVLNNGFSASTPHLGFDGVSLFNAAHPTNGGPTYRNTPSSPIDWSYEGYKEAITSLKELKDPRNIPFDFAMDDSYYIVHPPALNIDVNSVLNSTQVPGTADNDNNPLYQRDTPFEWRFLTSTTAYFFIPKDKSAHDLRWLQQMPLAVKTFDDGANTGNIRVRTRESYATLWETGYNIYGVNPA